MSNPSQFLDFHALNEQWLNVRLRIELLKEEEGQLFRLRNEAYVEWQKAEPNDES